VVRDDNGQWRDVVHWTLMAMITAEEMNITSANAPSMRDLSTDSRVRYLLGVEGNIGRAFGLDDAWVYNVISRVGNYGELYKRNLARFEKCGLSRGQNALIRDGGILHSPAFSEF
jgi:general L-amino acid transport system substrate-binding protein